MIDLAVVTDELEDLRNKMEELSTREIELKALLMQGMKDRDLKFYQTNYSEIRYYVNSFKTITDKCYLKLESELKNLKYQAIDDGNFTEKKTEIVSYTVKK